MSDDWIKQVERRLHHLETMHAVSDVHQAVIERRLAAIEDMLKWLVRLVMGAFLGAVVAFALKGGLSVI